MRGVPRFRGKIITVGNSQQTQWHTVFFETRGLFTGAAIVELRRAFWYSRSLVKSGEDVDTEVVEPEARVCVTKDGAVSHWATSFLVFRHSACASFIALRNSGAAARRDSGAASK